MKSTSTPARVTKKWLSLHRKDILGLDVPLRYEAVIVGLHHAPEILPMSRAAFAATALKPQALRRYLSTAHAIVIGLTSQQKIVAYCVAEFHRGHQKAYIVETCVSPSHGGNGLGTWLQKRIEAISIARKYSILASNVRVDNAVAIKLHLGCGMTIHSRIKEYYEDYSDGFYLTKELTKPDV
jgi:ribosomal protein S18 acetylase RimI-like enzyme